MKEILSAIFLAGIKIYYALKSRFTGNRIYRLLQDCFTYSYLKYFGVETEFGHVKLVGLPIIKRAEGSRIVLEKGVTLVSLSQGNVAGINHPVILATLAPGAIIRLNGCGLSGSSVCAARSIIIGKNSGLGANASVYDTDFHAVDSGGRLVQRNIAAAEAKPVEIGDDVWVAANVLILKGVLIGSGAVIGAGSVVTSGIPENALAAGNPARVLRIIEPRGTDKPGNHHPADTPPKTINE